MPPSPSPSPKKQDKTKQRINITVSPGRDQTLTQHLVDRSKLIDDECKQLVELAKEVQKHAVEHTKNVRYAHGRNIVSKRAQCSCIQLDAHITYCIVKG